MSSRFWCNALISSTVAPTYVGSTATITMQTDSNNLRVGDTVTIAGTTGGTGLNGTFTVASIPSSTTFTVTGTFSGTFTAGAGQTVAGGHWGTSTANWGTATGTGQGASVPTTGDSITFDANSGPAGTVITYDSSAATPRFNTFTISAFAGTIDFSVNNPPVNLDFFVDARTASHTLKMGGGNWNVAVLSGAAWNVSGSQTLTLSHTGSLIFD